MLYIERNLGSFEKCVLVPISDAHKGDRSFDEVKLRKLIDDISRVPYMYAFLTGDLINNAVKNGKSDVYSEKIAPNKQKWAVVDMLMPIRDRILGMTGGNHEERTWKESGQDVSEDIAKALKVPYDPFGIYFQLRCGIKPQQNYTLYTTHGTGGGGSMGNAVNKLHSMRNICVADIYVMGHTHRVISFNDEIFLPDLRHNKVIKQKRYYAMAGSYLDWGGYAERLMLSPHPTGFPIIDISGIKKKVNITI